MVGGEENEIIKFIKVWLIVILSLSYCYTISKNVAKGVKRLITLLPVVVLFFLLPLHLNSVHLGGTSGFFIAWLANFKLLLFAFNKGPLCSNSTISLPLFLAVACLPIKIQNDPSHNLDENRKAKVDPVRKSKISGDPDNFFNENGQIKGDPVVSPITINGLNSPFNYGAKLMVVAVLVKVYDYSEFIHPTLIMLLYCFHIYFMLEVILATVAFMARIVLGLELEPQFNNPFSSTSLQDFWGRRWNLMVTSILRPTVYDPIVLLCSRLIGRKRAVLLGVVSTFLVSAIMHELMFYYLGRQPPTWEVTWFFLLHGVCLMVEINVKKVFKGRFELPRLISQVFTTAFVMSTGLWLFFPPLMRCQVDQRAFEEYAAIGEFGKHLYHNISSYLQVCNK